MVKSADRVFFILETIANSVMGLTHSQIAESLHIPKSSLTSLLTNLLEREYVTLNSDNKRYCLGPMILFLAGRFMSGIDLVQIGIPIVNELMAATGESAGLTIKTGTDVLSIYSKNSAQPIMRSMHIGDRAPVYATAAGRAMLAFMNDGEIEQYLSSTDLRKITSKTICEPERLRQELETIRRAGVAFGREELYEGSMAIAAPIFDFTGNPVASIRVVFPSTRGNATTVKTAQIAVQKAAGMFSGKLGFSAKPK